MKLFPFLKASQWLSVLRITLSLFMIAHGAIRLYAGTVNDFGGFLNDKGLLVGGIIAWGITLFEIIGGILLILDLFKKIICLVFIIQLLIGIILVHATNGWFAVGYSSGGMEYSILLILGFLLTASNEEKSIN